ncbi:hypothetical protein IFM61392_07669 [Aspergillus lentulus]|uniref:AB hydrolase-1 domain-containing protein n=1 Tax=Aspergillus lentulus TaxID=293939 RepID=A0AAN5YTG2_ASPLE|nr:hypothetical protein CNMCM8060_009786 [Aspergillus lentulus]KAF4187664.1 hypothetical protein CNMCM7927_003610 [Aspergillus lentulus]KAF4194446.1 hypothetical protein CNMCM8694_007624 [Aspergillus lentulus]KAF4206407.1 hypothetical protein CNMCM8927_004801 [Aspergillus lentulus]GFG12934.1 hypothetical protein IFM61392_07669 [Aspergillus lentulus]
MASSLPSNGRLVNMGTRSLALYTHGPEPSSSKDPVVLFISGVPSDVLHWQAVVRLLCPSQRSYTYDRSGYHNSEASPLAPSAENVARELSLLIENAPIPNPLILVRHSALVMNVSDPIFWTVAADVDPYSAWGVEAEHKLTREKWDAFRAAEAAEKYKLIARKEDFENYMPNFETLRKKELSKKQPLVGDKSGYVIVGTRSRDWGGLYKAGVAKGNGTEEQRSYVRELIKTVDAKNEGLMKKSLKLSTKSAPVFATESGHCLQMAQPEFVVDGVKWVLHNLPASS